MDSKVAGNPVLDSILESKFKEVEESRRTRSAASLEREIAGMPHPFPLYREWTRTRGTGVKVIAEVKQKSPSRGILRDPYDPGEIAASYAKAGAKGISVLTDRPFFGGLLGHLAAVRDALGSGSRIPILRKDFLIDPYQVWESRHAGADIVLFIVRILEDALLKDMISQSHALGLSALVEVHSERELERAINAGAILVGVNHRDLDRLAMDLSLSERLAPLIPDEVLKVAESGLRSSRDRVRMEQLGYDAVLVGESFLSDAEPGKALERFLDDVD
jgi:indole-3-glycerol phosphate synthase